MRRIWLAVVAPSLIMVAHCTGDDPVVSGGVVDAGGANDVASPTDAPSSDGDVDGGTDAATDSPVDAPPSGTLDESFENGVKTAVTVNTGLAVAVDRFSRVYVAGNFDSCVSLTSRYDMAVLRFTATGAVDTTWGTAGRLCIDFGPDNGDTARAIAIDPADKVVVVGESITVPGLTTRIAIARINPDGNLDGTFGTGGRFRADDAATDLVFPFAVALDSVVTYVAASNGVAPGQRTKGVLVRVTGAGTLDLAFNQNTIGGGGGPGFLTDFTARAFFGVTVAGGNVFVAGSTVPPRSFIVRKHSSNGLRDSTFGTNGAVVTATSAGNDEARAVAVGSAGVVAAGVSSLASPFDDGQGPTTAVTYSATGAPVTTFGTGGVAKVEPAWLTNNQATGLLLDPDGRVVLGGVIDAGSVANRFDMAVTRLAANGTVDTSFGDGGLMRSGLPDSDVLYGMARDPITKKIVVLGSDAFTRVVLYRLHP